VVVWFARIGGHDLGLRPSVGSTPGTRSARVWLTALAPSLLSTVVSPWGLPTVFAAVRGQLPVFATGGVGQAPVVSP